MELFSREEIRDIVISVSAITIIFAYPFILNITILLTSFFAVVIGFLFHELAHKFVAIKFGATAFFKMWPQGIFFGFMLMVITGGFKFLAPGAVMIYPFKFSRWGHKKLNLDQTEFGIIGAAGPLVNISFAAIFSGLFSVFQFSPFFFISNINAFLGFFNLLPIPPLDGSKVMRWRPSLWLFLIISPLLLLLSQYSLYSSYFR